MTYLLLAFLIVILLPLFTATWRTSVRGLAIQGFLLAWIALRDERAISIHSAIVTIDLVLIRGLLVPWVLYKTLERNRAPLRSDVIAANFLSWGLAASLVFAAFRFARGVADSIGNSADATMTQSVTHIAVASSAIAIGFFVLASRNTVLSQAIGLVRIGNGVTLFELAGESHETPLMSVCTAAVVALTMLTLLRFFSSLSNPIAVDEGGAGLGSDL